MGKHSMIADIYTNETEWAEVWFIAAAVLFVIAAIITIVRTNRSYITTSTEGATRGLPSWVDEVAKDLGFVCLAFGLLVL